MMASPTAIGPPLATTKNGAVKKAMTGGTIDAASAGADSPLTITPFMIAPDQSSPAQSKPQTP